MDENELSVAWALFVVPCLCRQWLFDNGDADTLPAIPSTLRATAKANALERADVVSVPVGHEKLMINRLSAMT